MRVLPVDVEGLNLILGGGVPLFKRHETFADESATLLVRGPPGSGKTVLGTQLALSFASQLNVDVAYACVELLPTELSAQRAGLRPMIGAKERFIVPPFPQGNAKRDECRIYAGVLDLGTPRDEQVRLVPAIDGLLEAIHEAGGNPRVLVVDSLADGYHLGSTAPRPLADELCKLAVEKGLLLILLEETIESRPSAWSFATDLVIELSGATGEASNDSDAFERVLRVTKNRFGPSEPGTHRFTIFPRGGVVALPRPRTYLAQWATSIALPSKPRAPTVAQDWKHASQPKQAFRDSVTAVCSADEAWVAREAWKLGVSFQDRPVDGLDVVLDFSRISSPTPEHVASPSLIVRCGDPFLGGDGLLHRALAEIRRLTAEDHAIRRVLIGDLQAVRAFSNPEGIRLALAVLLSLLRYARIPAVLFETSAENSPACVDFADVIIRNPTVGGPPFSHRRQP